MRRLRALMQGWGRFWHDPLAFVDDLEPEGLRQAGLGILAVVIPRQRRAVYRQWRERGCDRAAALRLAWPKAGRLPRRIGRRAHAAWLAKNPAPPAPSSTVAITVVTPVFRPDPGFLAAAIASVAAQSHPCWRLVLALDGPVDAATEAVLAPWAADPRIRVVRLPRQSGVAAASNAAIAEADGEAVAFLDHDDLLHPEALGHLAAAFADADVGAVFSDEDIVDAKGRRQDPTFKGDFDPERLLAQNWVNHLFALRLPLLRSLGGLREGYQGAQDHDLVLRVAESLPASAIRRVPYILYHWRQFAGGQSLSQRQGAATEAARRRAVAEHLVRRGLSGQVASGPAGARVIWPEADPAAVVILTSGDVQFGPGARAALASLAMRPEVGGVIPRVADAEGLLEGQGVGLDEAGARRVLQTTHTTQEVQPVVLAVSRRALARVGADPGAEPAAVAMRLREAGLPILWTPDATATRVRGTATSGR